MENKNKNNSGALFKNKEKKTDKHPDYNGNIIINDTKYFLSAWVNESKNALIFDHSPLAILLIFIYSSSICLYLSYSF